VDDILTLLQRRWPLLLSVVMFLAAAAPTAVPRPLVDELRQVETAVASGKFEAALGHLDTLMSLLPQQTDLHLTAARIALLLEDPLRARRELEQLPAELRSSGQAACLADRAGLQLLEAPAAGWNGLLARCPQAAPDVEHFAERLLQDPAGKLGPVLSAVESAGLDTPTWRETAALYTAVEDPASAAPALREMVRADGSRSGLALELLDVLTAEPGGSFAAYDFARLGQAFARWGEWRFAILAFEQALQAEPGYTEVRAYLGLALDQVGRNGLAELERASNEAPAAALPHVFLGQHYSTQGDAERATRELVIAANLDPQNPAIAAELGSAYAVNGDLDQALTAYLAATELAPDDARFWLLLAQFSLTYELQIEQLGLPAARNAVTLSGGSPAALDSLGYAQLLQGNLILAERLIVQAVLDQPARAESLYHLGLLRIHQGDAQAGLAAFAAAEALAPQSPAAELARRAVETLQR